MGVLQPAHDARFEEHLLVGLECGRTSSRNKGGKERTRAEQDGDLGGVANGEGKPITVCSDLDETTREPQVLEAALEELRCLEDRSQQPRQHCHHRCGEPDRRVRAGRR